MKKSLIALAVLGFAGGAMAQSSVTLYGVADAGFGKINSPALGAAADPKIEMLGSSAMNNGTSRLGVRGVEDLGGGLQAGFNFEHGLNLENGAGNLSGGQMWSRAANLWIGGNWGTFKMGRTLNPSFYGLATWELTGAANYSVVGNTYGYTGEGPRTSNQFSYKTPNLGGFTAELGYVFKADNSDLAKWDLNAIYANGPIAAGLSVNKTKSQKTNYALGGKYNFGSFAVAASYNNANDAADLRRRGFSIGGTANLGAFALTLDLTRDTKNEWTGKKYTNGVLEGKYALSKRTFVYAAYLRFDGDNNYGIGLRHNF
ncbi:MAG TPA: porin [Ottowia sp.]|uniref:porin n=1 Tax=Ottowia sp. TaxID=1898956 RepID=UPI002B56DAED|nr:porin [Ottowia sp.]HMN19756.1 porin [Ottowia sp.]